MKGKEFYIVAILAIIFGGGLIAMNQTGCDVIYGLLWAMTSVFAVGVGIAVAAVLPLTESRRDDVHNGVIMGGVACAMAVLFCVYKHFSEVIETTTVWCWAISFIVCGAILMAVPSYIRRRREV